MTAYVYPPETFAGESDIPEREVSLHSREPETGRVIREHRKRREHSLNLTHSLTQRSLVVSFEGTAALR